MTGLPAGWEWLVERAEDGAVPGKFVAVRMRDGKRVERFAPDRGGVVRQAGEYEDALARLSVSVDPRPRGGGPIARVAAAYEGDEVVA